MLDLFTAPFAGGGLKLRIIGKYVAEVVSVIAAVVLDHRCGLGDLQKLRVDFRRIEGLPVDILNSPMAHDCPL